MKELITNLHLHTQYSDGSGTHQDILEAAMRSGLDVVIPTDHNVFVQGMDAYLRKGDHTVMLMCAEEVHDPTRLPQKNHLLVIGAGRELATFAPDPQNLLDQVQRAGGLSFIAHPKEHALPYFGETDITWENWDVHGFTGIEIWNSLSELKEVSHSLLQTIFHALFPATIAHGPLPETLALWDSLLARGDRVVAVGGSDAHALHKRLGPIRKTIFPYDFHFGAINTHLLTPEPLSGDLNFDRRMVLQALRDGHAFVGYDRPAPTRGFRFTAQGEENAMQGDIVRLHGGITLQIRLPGEAECRLLKDGAVVQTWHNQEICAHITTQPGVYRVECYIRYLGKLRGWIFSNPIYIREG
ncbi:predicted metal-dependent phosphoesterase [Longilinea arvoryzae]|uniref:Predicted metal-dependent phosphoesterase n=1 Tax=Longilinea arvoryzae TaxID=360412 RepID=A0A0S7BKR9_9CHLR|nr:CehA/McbA family metallohydrolase [Longilinea arvoryzae]GAP15126.1 predicted metal-dependent phosphoesterase [Longilinea arvoryzae]